MSALDQEKKVASAVGDSSQTCMNPRVALVLDADLESQTTPLLVYVGAGKQLAIAGQVNA